MPLVALKNTFSPNGFGWLKSKSVFLISPSTKNKAYDWTDSKSLLSPKIVYIVSNPNGSCLQFLVTFLG